MLSLMSLWNVLRNQRGQGMVEYALIIALIAVALVLALTNLGAGIGAIFAKITTSL
ncbi:MAG: Flp family type IVb pilin [Sulfobacillus sp.]|jgi:pilus assembly protein Flp/PilA